MSSSANYDNNNIVKLVSENYTTPAAAPIQSSFNENIINKNIITSNQQQQQRLRIKRPKSELGLNNITSNAAAFSLINLNETSNNTNNNSNFSQNIKQNSDASSNMYHTDYTAAFTNLNLNNSYLSIKKNFKLGLSNSNLSSNTKSSNIANSFTLSNNFNQHSARSHSNQNYRHYFFNRNRLIILPF